MKFDPTFTTIVMAAVVCITNAAPAGEYDPARPGDPGPNGSPFARKLWKCHPDQTKVKIDCKNSIDFFTNSFPPKSDRSGIYSFTHAAAPVPPAQLDPKTFYCPLHMRPEPANNCDFAIDYEVVNHDLPDAGITNYIVGFKDKAEYVLQKCAEEGNFAGGRIEIPTGSVSFYLDLRRTELPHTTTQGDHLKDLRIVGLG